MYDFDELEELEKGWIFYTAALGCLRQIALNLKGDKILDFGCGTGIGMALLKAIYPQKEFYGIEPSAKAKPFWDARNLNILVCGGEKVPLESKHFDTVFSSHVLEHIKDAEKALKESIRLAKQRVIHIVPDGDVHRENHLHIFNRVNLRKLVGEDAVIYHLPDLYMNSLVIIIDL